MKLSTILQTLATARLPSVTSEQLQQLVGTAEGKAFANDLRWYAAGEAERRQHLAAVVYALAPITHRTVEQLGFRFDLATIIAAAKLDGTAGFDIIKIATTNSENRGKAIAYLQGAGLQAKDVSAPAAAASPIDPPYYSFKIFGGTAAICVSEARTRTGNQATVQIEGALALGNNGHKEYDWRNKIIVQLTMQEAYLTLALFENMIQDVKFDGHGRTHDKSLHIQFQESHYFVRMMQRGKSLVAIPISPVDAIQIVSLLYKQIRLNEPHLEIQYIRGLIERMAATTKKGPPKLF